MTSLASYALHPSEYVTEGSGIMTIEGPVIFMHPVDYLWVAEPDLIVQLEKILAWRIKDALRRFDGHLG